MLTELNIMFRGKTIYVPVLYDGHRRFCHVNHDINVFNPHSVTAITL